MPTAANLRQALSKELTSEQSLFKTTYLGLLDLMQKRKKEYRDFCICAACTLSLLVLYRITCSLVVKFSLLPS